MDGERRNVPVPPAREEVLSVRDKKLADALRRNLLRRKQANTAGRSAADSDG